MSLIPLSLLKANVRADDYTADDRLLQQKLDAAERQALTWTRRSAEEMIALGDGEYPADFVEAVIGMASYRFDNPTDASASQYNNAMAAWYTMLKPYRKIGER